MAMNQSGWQWKATAQKWPERMRNGRPWPRLTVITPSYNQGRFIEETIRSVLQQGYPNLEYIIIDGGSTDNTVEILRKYEASLAYWVSEPDRGQSHALNKGLARATGEIVGWLNSDDMYTEGCFAHVMNAFARNPDALVVHGNRILLDADSHVSGWTQLPPFVPENTGYVIASETAFWRRQATAGMFFREDLHLAMDQDFFCRLYKTGEFIKLANFLGYFRCYPANKTTSIQDVCGHEAQQAWQRNVGEDLKGFRQIPRKQDKFTGALCLIRHPRTIGYPYLYRRLILRRRGL